MTALHRRRFILLSALALAAGVACAPSESTGLRGTGTVLYSSADGAPTSEATAAPSPTAQPTLMPTLMPTPTAQPTPALDPIVPSEALPPSAFGGPDAEEHVLPVPDGKPVIAALPVKRIVIPTIGLDSKVIQLGTKLDKNGNIAWETAPFAVGQHKGLAGPGQNGNMVLSGHISSPNEGAVFHHLPEIKVGDGVIVATDERQFLYTVTDIKTVTPDQVSVLDQTTDPTATLITCVPDGIYSHRLVVTAHLVG